MKYQIKCLLMQMFKVNRRDYLKLFRSPIKTDSASVWSEQWSQLNVWPSSDNISNYKASKTRQERFVMGRLNGLHLDSLIVDGVIVWFSGAGKMEAAVHVARGSARDQQQWTPSDLICFRSQQWNKYVCTFKLPHPTSVNHRRHGRIFGEKNIRLQFSALTVHIPSH